MPKDPISELMIWAARHGCTAIKFQKSQSDPSDPDGTFDCMSVLVHGVNVSSPILGHTKSLAKYNASARALALIQNKESPYFIERLCICQQVPKTAAATGSVNAYQRADNAAGAPESVDHISDSASVESMDESIIYHDLIKQSGEPGEVLVSDETTEGFALHARAVAHLYGNPVAVASSEVDSGDGEGAGSDGDEVVYQASGTTGTDVQGDMEIDL